jgi:hypothetical protein
MHGLKGEGCASGSRRKFLKSLGVLAGSAVLGPFSGKGIGVDALTGGILRSNRPRKLIYIAIDALHPEYVYLDSRGTGAALRETG